MSSLALMRWLESAPARYDTGMRLLTFGRVARLHACLAEAAARPGARVLEIGCGTGALTARLVARGAQVVALDQNPEMLAHARARLAEAPAVTWLEQTAAEIDRLDAGGFDAVVASLCLSEMAPGERRAVLREAARRLRPGGLLAVADEVVPRAAVWRIVHAVLRAPQAALGWVLVGRLSHPLADLADEIRAAGFRIRRETTWLGGRLVAVIAAPAP